MLYVLSIYRSKIEEDKFLLADNIDLYHVFIFSLK